MEIFDFILHIDQHLALFVQQHGVWIYALLFAIIFAETGFVVTPFLPGDSLLFAAGALAAIGEMNVHTLFFLLALAAILGDNVNYLTGHFLGERIFSDDARILKKDYLNRTHEFFEKHGGKTIIISRFLPMFRTFAPFVAGAGRMPFNRFFFFNVTGGIAWTASFIYGGYFFGNLPVIKQNFTLTVLVIIFLSLLPVIMEFWRHYRVRALPSEGQ